MVIPNLQSVQNLDSRHWRNSQFHLVLRSLFQVLCLFILLLFGHFIMFVFLQKHLHYQCLYCYCLTILSNFIPLIQLWVFNLAWFQCQWWLSFQDHWNTSSLPSLLQTLNLLYSLVLFIHSQCWSYHLRPIILQYIHMSRRSLSGLHGHRGCTWGFSRKFFAADITDLHNFLRIWNNKHTNCNNLCFIFHP